VLEFFVSYWLQVIRRKVIEIEFIRKISSLVDATQSLAEEAGRYSRRVLALRREMVCP